MVGTEKQFDFNYFANHHVERGRKHNNTGTGREMFKTHFDFDPNRPLSSSSTTATSKEPIKQHTKKMITSTTKLAADSPFNTNSSVSSSSNSTPSSNNCTFNSSKSLSSSAYWNNSQKVSDLLRETSNPTTPKESHNPSRKPEKSNIVFQMEDKPKSTPKKISQRTQSSISLTESNILPSSSSVRNVKTPSVDPSVLSKKVDQAEYGKTAYAQKPLWKARNKDYTTFKIN